MHGGRGQLHDSDGSMAEVTSSVKHNFLGSASAPTQVSILIRTNVSSGQEQSVIFSCISTS